MTMLERMAAVAAAGLLCGACSIGAASAPEIASPTRGAEDSGHGTNGTVTEALFDLKTAVCKAEHYADMPDYKPGQIVDNSGAFYLTSEIEDPVVKHPEDEKALEHLMYWAIPAGRPIMSTALGTKYFGGGGLAIEDTTDPSVALSPKSRNAVLTTLAATWNDKSAGVPFILSGASVAKDPTVSLIFKSNTLQVQAPDADAGFIVEMGLDVRCDGTPQGFHGKAYYSEDLLQQILHLPDVTDTASAVQKMRDRFCKASGLGNADCPISVFSMKDYCSWSVGGANDPAVQICGLTAASKVDVMTTMVDPKSIPSLY
jgi:hypothetical protein